EFDIMFASGISREGDLLDLGVARDMIKKSGAFYSFGDTRLGQGRENAKEFLHQNQSVAQEIEQRIRDEAFPKQNIPSPKFEPESEQKPLDISE
ncbi:MAG: DNA recombination/repair protein RecA, partial [bacterium]|nr:DNA recombination/repair protein RecA [bacterium]